MLNQVVLSLIFVVVDVRVHAVIPRDQFTSPVWNMLEIAFYMSAPVMAKCLRGTLVETVASCTGRPLRILVMKLVRFS